VPALSARFLPAAVIALALSVTACAGTSTPTARPTSTLAPAATPAAATATPAAATLAAATPAPSPAGAASTGIIKDRAFQPADIAVSVGATVTWTNQDGFGHTVTADDSSFDSGTMAGGATFSQAFATAGTFAYHCKIHPSMHGTVTVG
jgi:plastocyanin